MSRSWSARARTTSSKAAAATGEPFYAEAEEKLARFLCRIQIRSQEHPELDGAWYRAFNYRRWEYWASNADVGWGAWSVESGWTQGWITTVLALRRLGMSLWDLTAGSRIADGATTGSQSSCAHPVRRPRWVIWIRPVSSWKPTENSLMITECSWNPWQDPFERGRSG